MLCAILNKSWWQHPTRHQLDGHLLPITKTIQVRRTRHARHCWRSRDELIRDVLLWTPTYGRAKAGRPARTYIQQLCEDTGCCPEDLPRAMNDREEWRERVRDIRATSATWWWWNTYPLQRKQWAYSKPHNQATIYIYIYQAVRTNKMWQFKSILSGMNSDSSFSTSCPTKIKVFNLPFYLPIVAERIVRFIPFPRVDLYETQTISTSICILNIISSHLVKG